MLGCYDQNHTILIVNQDSNHPALATVEPNKVEAVGEKMMEVDPVTGGLILPKDDSPFMPGFQIALLGGDGRLFTWVPE